MFNPFQEQLKHSDTLDQIKSYLGNSAAGVAASHFPDLIFLDSNKFLKLENNKLQK